MTTLRKLTYFIANRVTRLASPSAQDWARAMLRELDFIANDWAAFFWAVGSIRILFHRPARPLAGFSDIPRAAQDLRRTIQRRTFAGYAVTLTEFACFAWFTFAIPHTMQRSGCALTAAAMLFWAYQLYCRRPRAIPAEPPACAASYRVELERQRDFFRGSWLCSRLAVMLPGIILFCLGGLAADPRSAAMYLKIAVGFAVLMAVAIPNSLRMARKFQQKIDDLDAVLNGPR